MYKLMAHFATIIHTGFYRFVGLKIVCIHQAIQAPAATRLTGCRYYTTAVSSRDGAGSFSLTRSRVRLLSRSYSLYSMIFFLFVALYR